MFLKDGVFIIVKYCRKEWDFRVIKLGKIGCVENEKLG